MSWYDPRDWLPDQESARDKSEDRWERQQNRELPGGRAGIEGQNPNEPNWNKIKEYGDAAGDLGRYGNKSYIGLGKESAQYRGQLRGQMLGQNSLSAEQLRQGLQSNMAGQQAMAASARPGAGAMSARTAMMTGGRMASGLAGQQAMAGIAERKAAADSLGAALASQRATDADVAMRGTQLGMQGHQIPMDDYTRRYGIDKGQGTGNSSGIGTVVGGVGGGVVGGIYGGPGGAAAGSQIGGAAGNWWDNR